MPATVQNLNDDVPLLDVEGVQKSYAGVRALAGVKLRVRAGTVHALLGENGAGKSTLMKIFAGELAPDAGTIQLHGQPIDFRQPADAQRAGVAMIHQELMLVPQMSVAENLFLGRLPRTRWGMVDYSRIRRQARELLGSLGLLANVDQPVGELNVASQQVVEIARALLSDPRLLILDEPTSALTSQEVDHLFNLIEQLKRQGVGMIYITHRLDELSRIADDVTVFRDGQWIYSGRFTDTSTDDLVRKMVGRDIPATLDRRVASHTKLLDVEGLSLSSRAAHAAPRLDDISLEVGRGEIVALFGLLGAGRTELLECLFGLHAGRVTGTATLAGQPLDFASPASAIRRGIALVPEDRKQTGLALDLPIYANISLACLTRLRRWRLIDRRAERRLADEYRQALTIKSSGLSQHVGTLSGGNQQKVVFAKWLATSPQLLLLDEPTRGVDIAAKFEIHSLIRQLATNGCGVLLASSELPEVLTLADRIVVLREGRVAANVPRHEADEATLLRAALPLGNQEAAA